MSSVKFKLLKMVLRVVTDGCSENSFLLKYQEIMDKYKK